MVRGRRWRADEQRTVRLPRAVSRFSASTRARRFLALACAAGIAIGVGACGSSSSSSSHAGGQANANNTADANNNGGYVDAGPITYQLEVSRELNPSSIEDRTYLSGVTTATPTPDEEWYGVFLWAKNQTKQPAPTASPSDFDIVDTQGNKYYPVSINTQVNPYGWTVQTLNPLQTYPLPSSTAFYGPTGGGELLFKINVSAYANRPLTLEIHAPGQTTPSTISLDL